MGQLSEDTCFCQSADNQYCMLAKENFSLNLIGRKISGALPLLLHAASSQILGISVQENLLVRAAEPNGVVKGRETLAKIHVQLLSSCVSPQTRQLWKQDCDLFHKAFLFIDATEQTANFTFLKLGNVQSHQEVKIMPD